MRRTVVFRVVLRLLGDAVSENHFLRLRRNDFKFFEKLLPDECDIVVFFLLSDAEALPPLRRSPTFIGDQSEFWSRTLGLTLSFIFGPEIS